MKELLRELFGKNKKERRLEAEKFIQEHPDMHEDQIAAALSWQNDFSTYPGYIPSNPVPSMSEVIKIRRENGTLLGHEKEELKI